MRWKPVLGLLSAAGILAGLGTGTATAQPSSTSSKLYQLYTNTYGIPKSVKAGTTFYADAWYMQDSPVWTSVTMYELLAWSKSAPTDRGLTVSWLNPLTHHWQASTLASWEESRLTLPGLGFSMAPHRWYKVQFKITVGKAVRSGTWHLSSQVNGIMGPNGTQAPDMQWLGNGDRLMRVYH